MLLSQTFEKLKWSITHPAELRDYIELYYYRDSVYKRTIQNSPLFDEAYYRANTGIDKSEDAAEHYLKNWRLPGHDPSEAFCSQEYLSLHGDVALSGLNPLLSYELYGKKTCYALSFLQEKKISFPEDAVYTAEEFSTSPPVHRRAAVVACFFSDGHIPETLSVLIEGLKEVADNVVLIGDCPVYEGELEKIEGLVCYARFLRHGQYDFGSYKRGLAFLRKKGLLNDADELILMNDSVVGPIYPFSGAFGRMADSPCDFWGLTGYGHTKERFFKTFISSYFYVFRRRVLEAGYPDRFLCDIEGAYDRNGVIMLLESEFTEYMTKRGFLWATLCTDLTLDNIYDPLTLIKKYRVPLLKKKAFEREQSEDMGEVCRIIRSNNERLGQLIKYSPKAPEGYRLPPVKEHRRSFKTKAERLNNKRDKLKVVFFTGAWDSFPGRSLFEKMLGQSRYSVCVAVIPDLRGGPDSIMTALIESAKKASRLAASGIPEELILHIKPDHLGQWPDVCVDADIAVYNSIYPYSSFRYLPKYAAGREFLPVLAVDTPLTKQEKRTDAVRYAWKIVTS